MHQLLEKELATYESRTPGSRDALKRAQPRMPLGVGQLRRHRFGRVVGLTQPGVNRRPQLGSRVMLRCNGHATNSKCKTRISPYGRNNIQYAGRRS